MSLARRVTCLEVAVGVQQQVRGLQVSVQHIGRVHVLEGLEDLVDEVLDVVYAERLLRVDDPVQVSLHEVAHNVDIVEGCEAGRAQDVHDVDDVVVAELAQQLDLSQDALGVYEVVKGVRHLLDGHLLLGLCVESADDHAVRAVPNRPQKLVLQIQLKHSPAHLELRSVEAK
jgi:hypothetical protein